MKHFAVIAVASATTSVFDWVESMNSPADLEQFELLQTGSTFAANANKIYDADGDGVEDNIKLTSAQLDDYFFPTVFNTAEDVYNTRNGAYPGHQSYEFYEGQAAP